MLTKNDIKIIKDIVSEAVVPLAKKSDVDKQLAEQKLTTQKGFTKLEKAIKKEHKIGGQILQLLEVEDRKIKLRVEKIEHHLGFASY